MEPGELLHLDDANEVIESGEIRRIASVDGQPVGDRCGRNRLVRDLIELRTEPNVVNASRTGGCICNHLARYERSPGDRFEFGNRFTVARDNDTRPRLNRSQNGTGVVAELSLSYCSLHLTEM